MTEYIFYKICCIDKNIDYTYIGSTKNLRVRKNAHKSSCTNEASKKYNRTLYKTIREYGGWENWTMSPIGKGIFENKIDALIEEQKIINDNNSTLNAIKAFNTKEEIVNNIKQYKKKYYESNKEELIERQIKYYETHKEEINTKKKEKTTCDCGGCYTYGHKARHFKSKIHIDYLTNINNTL